ncbi:hypothetical protein ASF49_09820 [Methylobacterium sp. Leaf104]|uniref:DUF2934 domain-containing protein n=1 Tax=Methylobacterium TaxID=407 RepID=UPI0006F729B6|nr:MULTISPECIES: DUF2934 domain-containing protein [Methylobacterium]KQP31728.1 hypothetical protein ASF49_09820 [Methylobacterium sp. Leaf104]MCI9880641.1 DUF2934 domain-containing protein [Methylobacterium goesingense]
MNPFEQQVRERAYYIWEDEGRVIGQAEAHWLRAENEILTPSRTGVEVLQAATADVTLSASPAVVLAETLKAKPSRSRSASAKVETKVKAETGTKAAEAGAAKAPVAKVAVAKAAATKAPVAKTAVAKAAVTKAPRAPARSRAAESVATVH